MAKPHEKLATSLEKLRALQTGGRRVFSSGELSRTDRERLLKSGFLLQVIKGWLISASPDSCTGDTTPWYSSFWEFCARYCNHRFGSTWYLAPDMSLKLHIGMRTIPKQLLVYAPKGTTTPVDLPFDTQLIDVRSTVPVGDKEFVVVDDLRLLSVPTALTRVSANFFSQNPIEARIVLSSIKDSSQVLRILLEGGQPVVAGRLAGAFRHVGRSDLADEIVETMRASGYPDCLEKNPFVDPRGSWVARVSALAAPREPIKELISSLWDASRDDVLSIFPQSPGLPSNTDDFLRQVDDAYKSDAYHSLSIEGYRVSMELIERVRSGRWNPESNPADKQDKNALAARGYWQAFQKVRECVSKVLQGAQPGQVARQSHRAWYREMFAPMVTAGACPAESLAGYRNHPVYIRRSRHTPINKNTVPDAMSILFDCLEKEESGAVRGVLGHWLFGYIHPYHDGNGRMARFLMNVMLASGGYPWTIIHLEDREEYMTALEAASTEHDIKPFARFLASEL